MTAIRRPLQVLSPTEQSVPSPTSPDYRTKAQSDEKEHFHILPQLQAKRADFLTVMLTGTLPQRRSFATPDEDVPEPPGPRDDDVTKSESNSEASQKTTERSQDAAPSTLMAEDQRVQREHISAGDGDPDLEDASKTLVLFSPGDTRKSPSGGDHVLEGELATPSALTPRNERLMIGEAAPEPSDTGRLSPALRTDLRPSTPIAPASPPFTKVERTFIHIAETSHLNVMSSNGHSAKESDFDILAITRELVVAEKIHREEGLPVEEKTPVTKSLSDQTPATDKYPKTENGLSVVMSQSLQPVPEDMSPVRDHRDVSQEPRHQLPSSEQPVKPQTTTPDRQTVIKPRTRSRIPVLICEEDSRSEQSSSLLAQVRLQQRARQLDLAHILVQKQQDRWMRRRMLSGTSSSLSSGDDARQRASETLSTTGSEEDTHVSDESTARRSCRLKPTEEQVSKECRSRIPRPVTPLTRPSMGFAAAVPCPLSLPDSSMTRAPSSTSNGQQKSGLSALNLQRKPNPVSSRSSSSCPRPSSVQAHSGSPRLPLRVLFRTQRSLSSTHSRTDSPSPQRSCPSRQPLSVRAPTLPVLPARTTAIMRRSASQEAAVRLSNGTAPAKTRPKTAGPPAKGKSSTREKVLPAR